MKKWTGSATPEKGLGCIWIVSPDLNILWHAKLKVKENLSELHFRKSYIIKDPDLYPQHGEMCKCKHALAVGLHREVTTIKSDIRKVVLLHLYQHISSFNTLSSGSKLQAVDQLRLNSSTSQREGFVGYNLIVFRLSLVQCFHDQLVYKGTRRTLLLPLTDHSSMVYTLLLV